jgi:hypothetical protein
LAFAAAREEVSVGRRRRAGRGRRRLRERGLGLELGGLGHGHGGGAWVHVPGDVYAKAGARVVCRNGRRGGGHRCSRRRQR